MPPRTRACNLCNSGLMAVRAADLFALLARVGNENARKGNIISPDIVMHRRAGRSRQRRGDRLTTSAPEVAGVNNRIELAAVGRRVGRQRQARADAMRRGRHPDCAGDGVLQPWDTQLGRDVTGGAQCLLRPRRDRGETGATIKGLQPSSRARRSGRRVHSRPLCPAAARRENPRRRRAKVGNFVEIKKATLGKGAKANHLTYLGDAEVGAGREHRRGHDHLQLRWLLQISRRRSAIGAFIGSNSSLIGRPGQASARTRSWRGQCGHYRDVAADWRAAAGRAPSSWSRPAGPTASTMR